MHHPTERIAHTTAFVTPVVEHWLEREIAQWVLPINDRSDDPSHHERTLLPRSYILLLSLPRSYNWLVKYLRNTEIARCSYGVEKGKALFNDAVNTFYFTVIWRRIYGKRITQIAREETCCRHYMGYSFQLAARDLIHALSHRQDRTYHGVW